MRIFIGYNAFRYALKHRHKKGAMGTFHTWLVAKWKHDLAWLVCFICNPHLIVLSVLCVITAILGTIMDTITELCMKKWWPKFCPIDPSKYQKQMEAETLKFRELIK